MKVFIYLDESGSIHKNSPTRYFAVGGYYVIGNDKNRIISRYKKINKKIKDNKGIPLSTEIKSYEMDDMEKVEIFRAVQEIDSFYGVAKVFDKNNMKKSVVEPNIFFNYAVKLVFTDCIIPMLNQSQEDEGLDFFVSVDNRNIRVGDLNNLETYLKTEFCLRNYDFHVKYYDSATNFGIQLADLTVNTFYNSYKDMRIVKKVMPYLKDRSFGVSLFPR